MHITLNMCADTWMHKHAPAKWRAVHPVSESIRGLLCRDLPRHVCGEVKTPSYPVPARVLPEAAYNAIECDRSLRLLRSLLRILRNSHAPPRT